MDYIDTVEVKDLVQQLDNAYKSKINQLNKWKEEGKVKYIIEKYDECISLTDSSLIKYCKFSNIMMEINTYMNNINEIRTSSIEELKNTQMRINDISNENITLDDKHKKLFSAFKSKLEGIIESDKEIIELMEKTKIEIIQIFKLNTYLFITIMAIKNKTNKLSILKDISVAIFSNLNPSIGSYVSLLNTSFDVIYGKILNYQNAQADAANNHLSIIEKYIELMTLVSNITLENIEAVLTFFNLLKTACDNAPWNKTSLET